MKRFSVLIEYFVDADNSEAAREAAFEFACKQQASGNIIAINCPADELVVEVEQL